MQDPAVSAHHEAAHAVVAVALGWTVGRVTIVPGAIEAGWCEAGRCDVQGPEEHVVRSYRGAALKTAAQVEAEVDRRLAKQHTVICSAGQVGEMMARASRAPGDLERFVGEVHQAGTDLSVVYTWAGYRGDGHVSPEMDRRVDAVFMRAFRLLSSPPARRAVAALATALMERQTIAGPEAEEIIRKARRSRP
jgi:ATP-dependent Zn protease